MEMHPRAMPLQLAQGDFGVFWSRAQQRLNVATFEEALIVLTRLDRFWITCSVNGLTTEQAAKAWSEKVAATAKPTPDESLASILKRQDRLLPVEEAAGNHIAQMVLEEELTYGEVYSVINNVRTTEIKYYLRAERHPDDPDKPSGLA